MRTRPQPVVLSPTIPGGNTTKPVTTRPASPPTPMDGPTTPPCPLTEASPR